MFNRRALCKGTVFLPNTELTWQLLRPDEATARRLPSVFRSVGGEFTRHPGINVNVSAEKEMVISIEGKTRRELIAGQEQETGEEARDEVPSKEQNFADQGGVKKLLNVSQTNRSRRLDGLLERALGAQNSRVPEESPRLVLQNEEFHKQLAHRTRARNSKINRKPPEFFDATYDWRQQTFAEDWKKTGYAKSQVVGLTSPNDHGNAAVGRKSAGFLKPDLGLTSVVEGGALSPFHGDLTYGAPQRAAASAKLKLNE
ncbi:hypothetical protein DFH09DRAFT_1089698 [Mycena vulgaris]|nr:hypothetical protein DFH09DRAFT_1089698 [Mycena vulgaris]